MPKRQQGESLAHYDARVAVAQSVAADRVEVLQRLLLTALALHGGEAHTHSEKEWRAEARAALGIKT